MRVTRTTRRFVGARSRAGVEIAIHDPRDTGQSLAASTGATRVDPRKQLGQTSSAATQRYMDAPEGPRPWTRPLHWQTPPFAGYGPVAEGRDKRLIDGSLNAPTGYAKGPRPAFPQVKSPFSTWWQVKDSNLRSFRDGFTVPRLQDRDQCKRLTRKNFRAYSPQIADDFRLQPDIPMGNVESTTIAFST